jgi:hypothetical protein
MLSKKEHRISLELLKTHPYITQQDEELEEKIVEEVEQAMENSQRLNYSH